jgi:hypothetical protein
MSTKQQAAEIKEVLGVTKKVGTTNRAYQQAVVKAYGDASKEALDKLSTATEDYIAGLTETFEAEGKDAGKSNGADKSAKTSGKKAKGKSAKKAGKSEKKAAKPKAAKKEPKEKKGPSYEDMIRGVVFGNPMIEGPKLVEKLRAKGCNASDRTIGTQAATFRGALRFLKRQGVKLDVELE